MNKGQIIKLKVGGTREKEINSGMEYQLKDMRVDKAIFKTGHTKNVKIVIPGIKCECARRLNDNVTHAVQLNIVEVVVEVDVAADVVLTVCLGAVSSMSLRTDAIFI